MNLEEIAKLKYLCEAPKDEIAMKYELEKLKSKNGVAYLKKKSSRILGVAHLDSKNEYSDFNIEEDLISCQTLDDRLGVYTLLEELPSRGIHLDILLTDNEEDGRSTISNLDLSFFDNYNWIVEFDRKGYDFVVYDDGIPEHIIAHVERYFHKGQGTGSDIKYLRDHPTACAFNIGIGYQEEHTEDAYMEIDVYDKQIETFVSFFNEFKNKIFNKKNKSI
ncbi:MAG: hypothetical protein JXA60_01355 [Candidatus Coatesbacteria bacterium]|nr:hypothetical protein [Candidatus Coatesbacteria bacterium]